MVSCPVCGRKFEAAAETCPCGHRFKQSVAGNTPESPNPPQEGGKTPASADTASGNRIESSEESKPKGDEPAAPTAGPTAEAQELAPGAETKTPADKPATPAPPETAREAEKKAVHEEDEAEAAEAEAEAETEAAEAEDEEEEEAEDVSDHEGLHIEEEAEDVESEAAKAPKKHRAKWANIIGISVNAVLLLIVIWLVTKKLGQEPPEPVTETVVVQVPVKQESSAVNDPTDAPPPPAVAIQGEPLSPEGTPARILEDALRNKGALQCRIERFRFDPDSGALAALLRKDAHWDIGELRRAADHDSLLILRTVFAASNVKTVDISIEARVSQRMGGGSYENALKLSVDQAGFAASGLARSKDTAIPPSFQPQYHEALRTAK